MRPQRLEPWRIFLMTALLVKPVIQNDDENMLRERAAVADASGL